MLLILPPNAQASNVGRSLSVGIQSVKTQVIRPLEPMERDIMSVYSLIYEPLIRINDDYLPEPCLAESWLAKDDGRTWIFNIRRGATFSDGTPLTAKDVVATASAILNRANDETVTDKGYYGNLRFFVSKITASDDYTVTIRTPSNRAYYGLLFALNFPILPESQIGTDDPIGSGPYIIADFSAGEYILLERNLNWWRTPAQVEQISFVCHDNQRAVIESYEYGQVRTIFTRSTAAAQYRSGTTSLSLDYRTPQLETLLMNHSYGRLSSLNVRLAIRYTIDIAALAENVYLGMVTRTDTPMVPGLWTYDQGVSGYFRHDLDEARRLLAEDGWGDSDENGFLDKLNSEGKKIELAMNLLVYEEPDNDVRIQAARLIETQLAQVGIKINVIISSYTDVQKDLKAGNFHLALASYAIDPCPDPGYLLISGNDGNYSRYKSQRMNTLCSELRKCVTKEAYEQKLMEIQQVFAEDCPFLCLYYRNGVVLTRNMYTTVRDVREYDLLRGIESFRP